MKLALFLLASVLLLSVPLGAAYAEKLSTNKGTLDVNLKVEPPTGDSSKSKLKIDFINPVTGIIQVHIDYMITVFDEFENNVFGPIPLTHTSLGAVTIPVEIDQNKKHSILVQVSGILFQPIDTESVEFIINSEEKPAPKENDGGCLIATAAYGTELAPQVQQLRHTRDLILQNSNAGSAFMASFNTIYYAFSPTVADFERENELFRDAVRAYITPMILTLSIMENADSEVQIISYGIGVILLNALLYILAPILAATMAYKKISKLARPASLYTPNHA